MNPLLKQKLKAFCIHLLSSICLALLMVFLVFRVLYPAPLDIASGVLTIFLMMLVVDIIIGPVLTFIVFKKNKPKLKLDIAIIVAFQLAALIYGMHSMYVARPAFAAFEEKKFLLIYANEVLQPEDKKYPVPRWGVKFVGANLAKQDPKEVISFIKDNVITGTRIEYHAKFYTPVEHVFDHIEAHSKSLDSLHKGNTDTVVQNILKKHPQADAYIPLQAKEEEMVVLIDKKNKKMVAIVNLQP